MGSSPTGSTTYRKSIMIDENTQSAIDKGWIEVSGVDENGELTFKVLRDNPMWDEHLSEVRRIEGVLLEKGLLEIVGVDDDGEFITRPTALARAWREGLEI